MDYKLSTNKHYNLYAKYFHDENEKLLLNKKYSSRDSLREIISNLEKRYSYKEITISRILLLSDLYRNSYPLGTYEINVSLGNKDIETYPLTIYATENHVYTNFRHEIGSIKKLFSYLDKYIELADTEAFKQALKEEKSDIKKDKIVLSIEELMNELKFSYTTKLDYKNKLVLILSFDNKKVFEIDITLSKYKKENLKKLINTLKNLNQQGFVIRHKAISKYKTYSWVTPNNI